MAESRSKARILHSLTVLYLHPSYLNLGAPQKLAWCAPIIDESQTLFCASSINVPEDLESVVVMWAIVIFSGPAS